MGGRRPVSQPHPVRRMIGRGGSKGTGSLSAFASQVPPTFPRCALIPLTALSRLSGSTDDASNARMPRTAPAVAAHVSASSPGHPILVADSVPSSEPQSAPHYAIIRSLITLCSRRSKPKQTHNWLCFGSTVHP